MKRLISLCLAVLLYSQTLVTLAQVKVTASETSRSEVTRSEDTRSGITDGKHQPSDVNNPLAKIKAFSLHNVYTSSLYDTDATSNTFWVRYAQPIGRFLLRASLPVSTVTNPTRSTSGLGDMNMFITFITSRPTARFQFGFGPTFSFPTATEKMLGTEKWDLGVALVGYFQHSEQFQAGFLATWQHSFAGNDERPDQHLASFQPMLLWQMGKGAYLRSTAIIGMDFKNDHYFVPLGLGIGKIIPARKTIFNLFVEPQFTLWHHGTAVPKLQLFIGINTQF